MCIVVMREEGSVRMWMVGEQTGCLGEMKNYIGWAKRMRGFINKKDDKYILVYLHLEMPVNAVVLSRTTIYLFVTYLLHALTLFLALPYLGEGEITAGDGVWIRRGRVELCVGAVSHVST